VKRWVGKVAVCVVVGAVVTWGVAWGCAWLPYRPYPLPPPRSLNRPAEGSARWTEWPVRLAWSDNWRTLHEVFAPLNVRSEVRELQLMDSGWPARSMRHSFACDSMGYPMIDTAISVPDLWSARPGDTRGLPLEVLPLGFALNTLLAAGVALGVVEGFGFVRRRRRRARGRCVWCGYERAGIGVRAVCPECGVG
jgi:hypothetical protein